MANTFIKIGTVTVGSGGASSISFTSIPSTYTDLCLKVSSRVDAGAEYSANVIRFNGSTSNLFCNYFFGNGVNLQSSTDTVIYTWANGSTSTSNTFGNMEIYIPNYTNSNNKSVGIDIVTENNNTTSIAACVSGLWSNTSAINQVTILPTAGSYVQYSTATLYGISKS